MYTWPWLGGDGSKGLGSTTQSHVEVLILQQGTEFTEDYALLGRVKILFGQEADLVSDPNVLREEIQNFIKNANILLRICKFSVECWRFQKKFVSLQHE